MAKVFLSIGKDIRIFKQNMNKVLSVFALKGSLKPLMVRGILIILFFRK